MESLRTSKIAHEEKRRREVEEKMLHEKTIKATIFHRYGDSVLCPSAGKKPKVGGQSSKEISNRVHGNTSSSKVRNESI